jgi:hypothetical protein
MFFLKFAVEEVEGFGVLGRARREGLFEEVATAFEFGAALFRGKEGDARGYMGGMRRRVEAEIARRKDEGGREEQEERTRMRRSQRGEKREEERRGDIRSA